MAFATLGLDGLGRVRKKEDVDGRLTRDPVYTHTLGSGSVAAVVRSAIHMGQYRNLILTNTSKYISTEEIPKVGIFLL